MSLPHDQYATSSSSSSSTSSSSTSSSSSSSTSSSSSKAYYINKNVFLCKNVYFFYVWKLMGHPVYNYVLAQ